MKTPKLPLLFFTYVAVALQPLAMDAQVTPGPPPTAAPVAPLLTLTQLEELVGRVALYPDDLLALVLPASTTPLDVVKGQRFLVKYEKDKTLKPDPTIPAPVLNLLTYPDVVVLMADDLEWTETLGLAVTAQQPDVLEAVQIFRRKAQSTGNLVSDEKQTIVVQQDMVQIVPAKPDIIYVPQYQPQTVIVQQPAPAVTYLPTPYPVYYRPLNGVGAAAVGFAAGAATAYGMNWHGGGICYGPARAEYWQDQRRDYANDAREDWQDYGKGRQEDWQQHSNDAQSQRQNAAQDNQSARQQSASDNQAQRQQSAQERSSGNQAQRQESLAQGQPQRQQAAGGSVGQVPRTPPAGTQSWQAAGQSRPAGSPGAAQPATANRTAGGANTAKKPERSSGSQQFGARPSGGAPANAFSGTSAGSQTRSESQRGAQSTTKKSSGAERTASSGGGRSGEGGGRSSSNGGGRSGDAGGRSPSGGGGRGDGGGRGR